MTHSTVNTPWSCLSRLWCKGTARALLTIPITGLVSSVISSTHCPDTFRTNSFFNHCIAQTAAQKTNQMKEPFGAFLVKTGAVNKAVLGKKAPSLQLSTVHGRLQAHQTDTSLGLTGCAVATSKTCQRQNTHEWAWFRKGPAAVFFLKFNQQLFKNAAETHLCTKLRLLPVFLEKNKEKERDVYMDFRSVPWWK